MEREWLAQARRGVIELCVLSLISQAPHYGYELATALDGPLATSEGTLYPLLRRLQREGLVDATWQESPDGPPRKYYQLSEAGTRLLAAQLAEWDELTEAIAHLRSQSDQRSQSNPRPQSNPRSQSNRADEEVPDGFQR